MNIGYACKCIAVPDTQISTCIAAKVTEEHLTELIRRNLTALDRILDYNIDNGIRLFRISSDLIPFGSSPLNTLDWRDLFSDTLHDLGNKAMAAGIRLSLHPGQYTVLNSPDPDVVGRAAADLIYHCDILDAMGLPSRHKLILHIGGVYGDKELAVDRFCRNYDRLPEVVKKRLVIENDERSYNISDVCGIGRKMGIPVVFDNLHYRLNLPDQAETEAVWLQICKETWREADGPQKMHYASQAEGKRPGAHSQMIFIDTFLEFIGRTECRDVDIMLEVKDKNRSAVKCINCTAGNGTSADLKREWERYRCEILSRSQIVYRQMESLLKDGSPSPAIEFYRLAELALSSRGSGKEQLAAMDYVWEQLKENAGDRDTKQYIKYINAFRQEQAGEQVIRRHLYRMAVKQQAAELLQSYYFS